VPVPQACTHFHKDMRAHNTPAARTGRGSARRAGGKCRSWDGARRGVAGKWVAGVAWLLSHDVVCKIHVIETEVVEKKSTYPW
jgi:hypothetical protein